MVRYHGKQIIDITFESDKIGITLDVIRIFKEKIVFPAKILLGKTDTLRYLKCRLFRRCRRHRPGAVLLPGAGAELYARTLLSEAL